MKEHAPRILGGFLKGRALSVPRGRATRPLRVLARRSLFDILGPLLDEARVLDLFAGAGSVGLEAVSRGAGEVLLVENGREAIRALRQSIDAFGIGERARVVGMAAHEFVDQAAAGAFDFIFVGPPYPLLRDGDEHLRAALAGLPRLVAAAGWLVLETPVELPCPPLAGLDRVDERTFGDTRLSFFTPPSAAD